MRQMRLESQDRESADCKDLDCGGEMKSLLIGAYMSLDGLNVSWKAYQLATTADENAERLMA